MRRQSDCGIDTDPLLIPTELFKGHHTLYLGKQGVISPTANIGAWMYFGTTLSHQNASSRNCLTAESFNTSPLPCTITTVPGTAACLLMCHDLLPKFYYSHNLLTC